jgi:hypothetical protein
MNPSRPTPRPAGSVAQPTRPLRGYRAGRRKAGAGFPVFSAGAQPTESTLISNTRSAFGGIFDPDPVSP